MGIWAFTNLALVWSLLLGGSAEQLGVRQAGGDLGSIIPRSKFEEMLKHRNDDVCPGRGFYTYDAFITAAKSFPGFGTTGNVTTRKREIAAFFGQTSHETTEKPTGGPYTLGYCLVKRLVGETFCSESDTDYPCASGKKYYSRGPMQLTWNDIYGKCGKAIGEDLLNNPDLVETDPVISFKTAIWLWITPQSPKPACHDVITGKWSPSAADERDGRFPGYGLITNIINGVYECGSDENERVENRIGYYKRYCDLLGVEYGDNLDCYTQRPFEFGLLESVDTI